MTKKLIILLLSIIVVVCGIFCIYHIFTSKINITDSEKAYITFKYNGKNIEEELTELETNEIRKMIDGKNFFYDNGMSCGFTKDISVTFKGFIFDDVVCVACDGCNTLKIGKKTVNISSKERKRINEIFEKYGGFFPAV